MTTRIEVPGTGGGGGGAPTNAEYLVGALDATLTNERLVTDTSTVAWDLATGGQAKANVPDDSITYAKIQNVSGASLLLGRGAGGGAGDPQEISLGTNLSMSGTTLNASGGGAGASWTEVEVDFGTKPEWSKTFTIIDGTVSGTSKIIVVPSGNVGTSRVGNDLEWDNLILGAIAGAGQFILTALSVPGPVVGNRKVFYTVA